MPTIRVTNKSANSLSLGSPLKTLEPRGTQSTDVSVAELESLSESLTELHDKGLITWSVDTSSEGIEFFPSGASTTKTQGRLDIYVNATTGSDTNYGTKEQPLATLVEAERRIPDFVNHPVVIHVGPHAGNGYARPEFRERVMRKSIDVYAPDVNVLYEGTAQAGSLHTKVVAPAGLGVETYRGKTIEMTSGLQKGFRRTISTHTDTDIEPCILWQGGSIQPGDTFRIFEPATNIYIDADTRWHVTSGPAKSVSLGFSGDNTIQTGVNFVNFRFLSEDLFVAIISGESVGLFGCEAADATRLNLYGGSFAVGVEAVDNAEDASDEREVVYVGTRAAGVDKNAWVGWGLSVRAMMGLTGALDVGLYGVVAEQLLAYGGSCRLAGGNIYERGVWVANSGVEGPETFIVHGKYYLPDLRVRITATTGDAILLQGDGVNASLDAVTITADAGKALVVKGGAKCTIKAEVSLIGTVGITAVQGAVVRLDPGGGAITATGNEIEVGNTPTVGTLAANLANGGDYLSEADGSVVQRIS